MRGAWVALRKQYSAYSTPPVQLEQVSNFWRTMGRFLESQSVQGTEHVVAKQYDVERREQHAKVVVRLHRADV